MGGRIIDRSGFLLKDLSKSADEAAERQAGPGSFRGSLGSAVEVHHRSR